MVLDLVKYEHHGGGNGGGGSLKRQIQGPLSRNCIPVGQIGPQESAFGTIWIQVVWGELKLRNADE